MTSRERVIRAVEFRGPDRLPCDFPQFGRTDFAHVGWNQIGTGDKSKHETKDEWGCTWSRSDVKNMGLVTGHPLADWEALDSFVFPDPDDPALYEGMEERLAQAGDRYVVTGIFMLLFERLHSLHGFENTLMDLYEEPEKLGWLADRIVDFDIRIIENISRRFPGRIDGLNYSDDWGTQLNAFISTDMFDSFFKPRYKKIIDACKKAGWHVWMHSCGKVTSLIPSLIDAGVDVFDLLQPTVLGIREFGEKFAGKVAFQSLCDIQMTLPFKSDDEICAEARELLKYWTTPEGGFIISDYGDGTAIGTSDHKKKIMFDAFMAADPFARRA